VGSQAAKASASKLTATNPQSSSGALAIWCTPLRLVLGAWDVASVSRLHEWPSVARLEHARCRQSLLHVRSLTLPNLSHPQHSLKTRLVAAALRIYMCKMPNYKLVK
jgi:hypothetical protein